MIAPSGVGTRRPALGHTGGVTDLRLIQAARLLGLDRATLTEAAATAAIGAEPAVFGQALFAEAAENDDVTSGAAALDYLETRLRFFGDLVTHPEAVREAFRPGNESAPRPGRLLHCRLS